MRTEKDGISVRAIAGTHGVLFGMDATEAARAGLLGFALGRRDPAGEVRWLRGFKFFRDTVPDPQPGERRSTRDHPVQDFQWGDWSREPGTVVDHVIQPLYGTPSDLRPGPMLELRVPTMAADADHAVFYNRGAIPSQAFADRFGNVGPSPEEQDDPTNDKVRWLSRGLLEAALGFIGTAGPRHELRVAAYEFTYGPIARALRAAAGRGAKVQIVHDIGDRRRDGTLVPSHTSAANAATIAAAGLDGAANVTVLGRSRYSSITHNKFIVLLEDGHPAAVWTGSTNFTPSGFLGQSNLAHLIRSPALARAFSAYWDLLAADLDTRTMKRRVAELSPEPPAPLPEDAMIPIFSPRPKGMLDWYAAAMAQAHGSVMFTSAFGVARDLAEVFARPGDHLRLILSERAERDPEIWRLLTADADTRIATGARLNAETIAAGLEGAALDQWFRAEDHFRREGHIFYIHTKLMALDLMTDSPQIFTGSANFSANSVESNDENMVLMRGPAFRAVAEVHATEFMRLFNHLYFRTTAIRLARSGRGNPERAAVLDPDDRWVARHFREGGYHDRMRRLFR
ncbi:phospholipase D-like domain-containing protein [Frigidibacter oleivorans]|uniref:phospholipase D-like domain-containing protein n=1 Tax=Frigidibacter oleivorans TaxID=2487129 RepID=UPI000F8E51FD|nr:phospholipase D-like domain-containing protein [Frigidibacter oleivorans]